MRKLLHRHWLKWLLLIPTAAMVWGTFNRGAYFISTDRWYFWIGQEGCQLHHGWHVPNWGYREYAPDLPDGPKFSVWTVHFAALVLIAILFRRDWAAVIRFSFWRPRYPAGHCQQCGYNLTGNVSGVCPECGETIRSAAEIPPPSFISRATLGIYIFLLFAFMVLGAIGGLVRY